jgi:uncharacterized protein (DUF302 family)
MNAPESSGLVSIPSRYTVDETVSRLVGLLAEKGAKLFAVVDHSGEAATAGLPMPPTKVVIFGNPKGGTPLMLASPSVAIDLPLKLLIAQSSDPQAEVTVTWDSPSYLGARHHLPEELLANIAVIEALAHQAAG